MMKTIVALTTVFGTLASANTQHYFGGRESGAGYNPIQWTFNSRLHYLICNSANPGHPICTPFVYSHGV